MRSAISRAYYSLYHEALSFLRQWHKGKIIDEIKVALDGKKYDKTRLNNLEDEYIRDLGLNLHSIIANALDDLDWKFMISFKNFRDKRNQADYDLGLNFKYDESNTKVEEIEKLIKA